MNKRPMSLLEYCLATAATEGRPDDERPLEVIDAIHGAPLIAPETDRLPIPSTVDRAPTRHLLRSGSVL